MRNRYALAPAYAKPQRGDRVGSFDRAVPLHSLVTEPVEHWKWLAQRPNLGPRLELSPLDHPSQCRLARSVQPLEKLEMTNAPWSYPALSQRVGGVA